MIRPDFVTDEILEYLDELKGPKRTAMPGASKFLQDDFLISEERSKQILAYWILSYKERHPTK